MSEHPFDSLARTLAGGASRRGVLRAIGGAVLGGLVAAPAQTVLAAGNSACAHFCASVFGADTPAASQCTSDAAHGKGLCYTCGPAARAGHAAVCRTGTSGAMCCPSATPTCCDNTTCVNLQADLSNCGSCGHACTAGQTCSSGQCVCTSASCPNGCCNGITCVLFAAQSNSTCGAGGAMCVSCATSGAGHVCLSGICGCNTDTDCPADEACNNHVCSSACSASSPCNGGCCLNGTCVQGNTAAACGTTGLACVTCGITTDTCSNGSCVCGTTRAPCEAGQQCVNGACVCNATSCPSGCCNGNTCVPFASQSNSSCGTAGGACAACGPNQTCVNGTCASICTQGFVCGQAQSCNTQVSCSLFNRPACICAAPVEGGALLCNNWCFDCNNPPSTCSSSAECVASMGAGAACFSTCCGNRCIPPCNAVTAARTAARPAIAGVTPVDPTVGR